MQTRHNVLQAATSSVGRQDSSRAPGQYSKYGLEAPGSASVGQEAEGDITGDDKDLGEANGMDEQGGGGVPRRHLSAAERKALRKVWEGRHTHGICTFTLSRGRRCSTFAILLTNVTCCQQPSSLVSMPCRHMLIKCLCITATSLACR